MFFRRSFPIRIGILLLLIPLGRVAFADKDVARPKYDWPEGRVGKVVYKSVKKRVHGEDVKSSVRARSKRSAFD